jgi:hypothetical protein
MASEKQKDTACAKFGFFAYFVRITALNHTSICLVELAIIDKASYLIHAHGARF